MDCKPTRVLCPWDFPGKNSGVGYHFLLQGIFLTHGLNSGLLDWQVDSLPTELLGKTYLSSVPCSLLFCLPIISIKAAAAAAKSL